MEFHFPSGKHRTSYDPNINLAMDYDSGYMSQNHESTTDSFTEPEEHHAPPSRPIYFTEDALLETPDRSSVRYNSYSNNTETERIGIFQSPDYVNASVATDKSCLSGFKENPDSSIENSDNSIEIFPTPAIVIDSHEIPHDNLCSNDYLSNITNTRNNASSIRIQIIENRVIKEADKENMNNIAKSVKKTPKKQQLKNQVNPEFSPDLFGDEVFHKNETKVSPAVEAKTAEEQYIVRKDYAILKRVQLGLNSVLPPPSVTSMQITASDMLSKIKENQQYFWTNSTTTNDTAKQSKSLLVNVNTLNDVLNKQWPNVLEDRYHGLHFNRSKVSEQFELLCDKFGQRCVGNETQSSCTSFEQTSTSPSRRKSQKQRWAVKSPGRRLSHLARRRITFSSANLQAGGSNMGGSRSRQILVDAKKMNLLSKRKSPRKTPKKTPSKSPRLKARTPSSSAKKKLAMRFRKMTGDIEKSVPSTSTSEHSSTSSKRALFQSPERDSKCLFSANTSSSSSGLSFDNSAKKLPPKRALFRSPRKNSPPSKRNSPFKMDKKRKRSESDDSQPSKIARSMSFDVRSTVEPQNKVSSLLSRTKSEAVLKPQPVGELSAIHKKKLQWAVYEALRSQNVTPSHAQFKVFASVLARVTRRFLPNLSPNAPRPEGGTSDRMLRTARHHVYGVIKGKSVDEIVNEYLKNRSKSAKPQGYVPLDDFQNNRSTLNKENVFQDCANTIESMEKRKLEMLDKPNENKIQRIKKAINFDNR